MSVGKWESCLWISTFPRGSSRGWGNVGIAKRFQGKLVGSDGKLRFWFSSLSHSPDSVPQPVLHAIFRTSNVANSFRFVLPASFRAAPVSLSAPATCQLQISSTVKRLPSGIRPARSS